MSDYTVRRVDAIESIHRGGFRKARAALGVRSFGMQILEFPPHFDRHPEHDHAGSGQEEVYVVLEGSGVVEVDGERVPMDQETLVRIGPEARRKIYAGAEGLRVLALGAVPGQPYRAPRFTEIGVSDLSTELPNSELRRLLSDPECPVEVEAGKCVLALTDFHQFAKRRFGQIDGMEERLDQFLTHMGGTLLNRPDGIAFAFPESILAEVQQPKRGRAAPR